MTREEARAEADQAAQEFAAQMAEGSTTTGIPKPPKVTITETSTDVEPFGLDFEPQSTVVQGEGGPPGPPPDCTPCSLRHLSIRFRCAGNIQCDQCFPNCGLANWDCGLMGLPPPIELDIDPCGSFSHNFTVDIGDSLCSDWYACDTSGDPATCGFHAGVLMTLVGGHTLHFDYGGNTYSAFTRVTHDCNGNPTECAGTYDSGSDGLPTIPPDIAVPDWCAARGTNLFSYNGFWSPEFPLRACDCFGGSKRILLGFGIYIYILVT
jgi:hypothetical protein